MKKKKRIMVDLGCVLPMDRERPMDFMLWGYEHTNFFKITRTDKERGFLEGYCSGEPEVHY